MYKNNASAQSDRFVSDHGGIGIRRGKNVGVASVSRGEQRILMGREPNLKGRDLVVNAERSCSQFFRRHDSGWQRIRSSHPSGTFARVFSVYTHTHLFHSCHTALEYKGAVLHRTFPQTLA